MRILGIDPGMPRVGSAHGEQVKVLEAVMHEGDLQTAPRPDDAADALAVALTGWFQR